MKRAAAFTIAILLALLSFLSAYAESSPFDAAFTSAAGTLQSGNEPAVGSIGGEWTVIGLARAGMLPEGFAEGYYRNVVDTVTANGSAQLDENKATENARVILALTAIHKDPREVAGYSLLEPLADFDFVTYQGINGAIWTLIALDSYCYEIPDAPQGKTQTTRERLIEEILACQLDEGGWDLVDIASDTDLTAMAITALAPYADKNDDVRRAVDRALAWLSSVQHENGAFNSFGADSPETEAQMLLALSTLGIDAANDARFLQNGKGAIDALLSFAVDGGFKHSKSGDLNRMSTEQAFYAMTAYRRFQARQAPLFDMTDLALANDVNLDGNVDVVDATAIQKYCAGLAEPSLLQQRLADTNADGAVNVADATYIQNLLVRRAS